MRLGIDPEFAIINKTSGKGRSAHLFLGVGPKGVGAKEKIVTYEKTQIGAEMDRDGTNLEVRSLAPTACRDNIVPYVAECMRQTQLKLEKWDDKFRLGTNATYELDMHSLNAKQKPPKDVLQWGCRPDIDAYALTPKQPNPPEGRTRYTGGHLHMSPIMAGANDIEAQAVVAIIHDYFIGLPLVAILGKKFAKGEVERRFVYGQAGSFRYSHSDNRFEYRVPSSRIMLSPILLTWAMGVQRCFQSHLPQSTYGNTKGTKVYRDLLFDKLMPYIKPGTVADIINRHDVDGAKELYPQIFPFMPGYNKNDKQALANTLAGGGGSTRNIFFYERMVDLFVAANEAGIGWEDDIKHNWGLYEEYYPMHHAYWAIGVASVGLTDEKIFPQRALIDKFIPKEYLAKKPVYTHPLDGGDKKFVTAGAQNWLL